MTEVPLCEFNIVKLYKIDSKIDTFSLTDDQCIRFTSTITNNDNNDDNDNDDNDNANNRSNNTVGTTFEFARNGELDLKANHFR